MTAKNVRLSKGPQQVSHYCEIYTAVALHATSVYEAKSRNETSPSPNSHWSAIIHSRADITLFRQPLQQQSVSYDCRSCSVIQFMLLHERRVCAKASKRNRRFRAKLRSGVGLFLPRHLSRMTTPCKVKPLCKHQQLISHYSLS